MAVSLRPATPSDVPTLEIIRRQAIEAGFSPHYPRHRYADLVATPDPDLPEYVERDAFVTVVAETPVTPAAYAAGRLADGELLAVYTTPDYERRGYGKRVVDRVADHVRQTGGERLFVWAPDHTRPFFEACGFQATEERTEDPVSQIRMERSL